MTCGLGLGLLVVFFVQAEHVCCFWTKGAQNIQNSNTYVGFTPPDGRWLKSVSYPQNQVRQGFVSPHSVQSSSFNTAPAVYSGSGPGLSSRSSKQVVSQPAHSSVRLVQSNPMFKANRQKVFSPRANAPNVLKLSSGLSAAAGGSSVSLNQKKPSDLSRRSWPVQQGLQRSSKYPASSSQSLQASRESYSFRPVSLQSAAQEPSRAAAKIPFSQSKVSASAGLFGPVAPRQGGPSVRMQTYARGPAKRVSSNRRSGGAKSRRLSPLPKSWKPSVGQEGGSRPRSWLQTYKTSLNLAVPRNSAVGASAQGSSVFAIPEDFGGFAIRRLTEPADQNTVTVQKQQLQIPTAAPQWLVPSTLYPYPEVRWSRLKL